MERPWPVTRRSVALLAATWLLDRGVGSLFAQDAGSSAGKADLPLWVRGSRFRFRHYAVNATVILASIPIFTKASVGGALLSIEEQGGSERGAIGLQFGAGSWPERSHGLNRFGMTQELVRIDNCNIAESNYFSFMTSCRESNFSQAEQAFRSAADCLPLTIARGRSTAAGCTAKILHETVSTNFSWADCPKLSDDLRQRIPPVSGNAEPGYTRDALPTFLYAVRRAAVETVTLSSPTPFST